MQLSTFISNAIILALAWTATAGPIEKRSPLILTLHRDLLVKNLKLKSFSAILKLPKEADDEKIVKFAHVGWQWVQKQGGATASEKAPGAMVALQSRLEPEKVSHLSRSFLVPTLTQGARSCGWRPRSRAGQVNTGPS